MQNYLAGFGEWVLVLQGVIFVLTVLLFRRGIVGEIEARAARLRPKRKLADAAEMPSRG
jgi:branched-chain amino acid transport system permease protein